MKMFIFLFYLSYQDGKEVYQDDRVTFEITTEEITLVCKSAKMTDMGRYNLTLTNDMGSDSVPLNVIVVGKFGKVYCFICSLLILSNICMSEITQSLFIFDLMYSCNIHQEVY